MQQGFYHNQIEAIIGLQLACCLDYHNVTNILEFNTDKLIQFNQGYISKDYSVDSDYFIGFMTYLLKNYDTCIDTMVKFVPADKAEYLFRRCVHIISVSNTDQDIEFIMRLQIALKIPKEVAKRITDEILEGRIVGAEVDNYIIQFGKYGFVERDAFGPISNGIERIER